MEEWHPPLSHGDLIVAPTSRGDMEEISPPNRDMASSAVADALESAIDLVAPVQRARAARNATVVRMDAAVCNQRRTAVLPPVAAAALSAALAMTAAMGASLLAAPGEVGHGGALAVLADAAALGALVAVALRHAADRSRRRAARLAWIAAALAAVLGLGAFCFDRALAARDPGRLLTIIGVACAAAIPWIFARLATAEVKRLATEFDAASAVVARAEEQARRALRSARSVFEAEISTIEAAMAGDQTETWLNDPARWGHVGRAPLAPASAGRAIPDSALAWPARQRSHSSLRRLARGSLDDGEEETYGG